jgi:hypothetical protein
VRVALNGDLTAGLIHCLRQLCPGRPCLEETPADKKMALSYTLYSLQQLMEAYGRHNCEEFWGPAIRAGIVEALSDLLKHSDGPTAMGLLRLSGCMLLDAPPRGVQEWARGLPRAIAGLITANPPLVAGPAADLLLSVGIKRPELLFGFDSCGLEDGVRRLSTDIDPDTAAVAKGLVYFATRIARDCNVRSTPQTAFIPCSAVLRQPAFDCWNRYIPRPHPRISSLSLSLSHTHTHSHSHSLFFSLFVCLSVCC